MNFKNNELLMLGGAFILGVFVDRYMNHRDIVTGKVKEGVDTKKETDPKKGTDPKKVTKVGPDTYPQHESDMSYYLKLGALFGGVIAAAVVVGLANHFGQKNQGQRDTGPTAVEHAKTLRDGGWY